MNEAIEESRLNLQSREYQINHNLFVAFVEDQYPNLHAAALKEERQEALERLEEIKWKFPHDVDIELNCTDKLRYLNTLVKSYTDATYDVRYTRQQHAAKYARPRASKDDAAPTKPVRGPYQELYYDRPPPEAPVQKEGVGDGRSPYEACLLDLRAQRAAHDELRDVEGRAPRKDRKWWEKMRLPGEKK